MRDSTKKRIVGGLVAGACALAIVNGAVTLKGTIDDKKAEKDAGNQTTVTEEAND